MEQPISERVPFAALQVKLAHAADRYRSRFGKAHAVYGNGTLASCCAKHRRSVEKRLDNTEYADCMIKALEAVVKFRNEHKCV